MNGFNSASAVIKQINTWLNHKRKYKTFAKKINGIQVPTTSGKIQFLKQCRQH